MKKKRYLMFSILSALGISSLGIASSFSSHSMQNVFGDDCSHKGNHYASTDKYVEFWTCCNCNETFLTKPSSGTFVDNARENMIGGVPSIAVIEKGIENLPSSIEPFSNFEKVKNANLLYTLNRKISLLSNEDKEKLSLDKFNAAKSDYDLYVTPIFGFNDSDTITPLGGSQITSISKIENETYGEMFDALFEENAAMKNHGMVLNNLNSSFSSFESVCLIAINDLYAWGDGTSEIVDKINFQNSDELVSSPLPGYMKDGGYGNGVGFEEFKFSAATSFVNPILNYQNTWGVTDNGHTHLYFTGLFGINKSDYEEKANEVTSLINKVTSLKITSNEIAAQATLLTKGIKEKYEALPEKAKALVTNYSDLETLETTLTSYTYMLETAAFSVMKSDTEYYSSYTFTSRFDEDYGNITHIKCSEEIGNNVSISFDFSNAKKALEGYSKIIVFLRTPNLISGISGILDGGDPYLYLSTGTIKDSWVANADQDLKSTTSQKVNGIRLLNIIPTSATGYGELEFSSFVLIKDGASYSALH